MLYMGSDEFSERLAAEPDTAEPLPVPTGRSFLIQPSLAFNSMHTNAKKNAALPHTRCVELTL